MRRILGLGAVVLVAGLAPAAANATTFSGTCDDIAGKALFDKPLKSDPAPNHYDFSGTAHCDGTVDGKKLPDKSPVHVHVAGDGNLGCQSGEGKDGKGTITLDATGQTVGFLMDFTSTASQVDIKLRGAKGGSGTGSASFIDQNNPVQNLATLQNCAGDGNHSLSFTAKANVPDGTPLNDGQSATAEKPAAGSQPSSGTQESSAPTTGSSQSGSASQPAAQQPQSTQQSKPQAKKKHKKKKHKKHPKKSKKKKKSKKGKRH